MKEGLLVFLKQVGALTRFFLMVNITERSLCFSVFSDFESAIRRIFIILCRIVV